MEIAGLSTHFCCPADAAATRQQWQQVSQIFSELSALVSAVSAHAPVPMLHVASGAPAALFPEMQVPCCSLASNVSFGSVHQRAVLLPPAHLHLSLPPPLLVLVLLVPRPSPHA